MIARKNLAYVLGTLIVGLALLSTTVLHQSAPVLPAPLDPVPVVAAKQLPSVSIARKLRLLPFPRAIQTATVIGADDGDSLTVITGGRRERVRIVGINAPELAEGNMPSQCYALEAYARIKTDLVGKVVVITPDPKQADRDGQGRLLRYVSLGDGTDYGRRLISEGTVKEYTFHGVPHYFQHEYQVAEAGAEKSGQGLWAKAACGGEISKAGVFMLGAAYYRGPDPGPHPDCSKFPNQDLAQRYYESHGGPFRDDYGLDSNHNGRACESLT